jgi:pimeloyl-ACP methyl ester carboxylesterase
VLELGPAAGRTCLLLHPMLFPALPLPGFRHLLDRFGIRLLAPLRPGFNGSDCGVPASATPQERISGYVAALGEMLSLFGIDSVPVLSIVFGAPWAVELARTYPQHVESILFVAAPTPPGEMPHRRSLSFTRSLVPFALRMPHAAETLVRLHARLLTNDRLVAAGFRAAFRDGPEDSAVADALTRDGWVQKWIRHMLTHAVAGIAGDLRANTVDWAQNLGQLACPLTFLHGERDRISDIATMRVLARKHPHARLSVAEGQGQLFYLSAPELILQEMQAEPLGG